jgi:acetate kinase
MILVINSGSSSLKFRLYDKQLGLLAAGLVERIGQRDSFLDWRAAGNSGRLDWATGVKDHRAALKAVFAALQELGFDLAAVKTVGHRVVHGGEAFTEPVVVTPAVEKQIAGFSHLAPLHNPANLSGIKAARKLLPQAKQVAMFDTGFYRTLPEHAFIYSLPWELYAKHGIRKYGFHGISHDYVSGEAAKRLGKPRSQLKLVTCHLGSGASVSAIRHGRAIDTTMGFTPLEGLTMSTRCGDIDPAIPVYLIKQLKMSPEAVDQLMNQRSGLLGLCGYKDLRDVLSAAGIKVPGYKFKGRVSAAVKHRAKLAYQVFCYDVARYIAQFAGVMGGCDAVIFTAGVGERNATVRRQIMSMVTLPGQPKVLAVPTNEELMIARAAKRLAG